MKNKWFSTLLFLCLIWYVVIYIVNVFDNWDAGYSSFIDMGVFLFLSVTYIIKYRKTDVLCFEIMFIPVYFLGLFYSEVVIGGMQIAEQGIGGMMNYVVTQSSFLLKSRIVQMLAFVIFLFGCIIGNNERIKLSNNWNNYKVLNREINYKTVTIILSGVLLLILIYDYQTGVFNTWYAYTLGLSDAERNKGLGHISALCLMMTLTEFSRLSQNNVNNWRLFFKKCNPLYLAETGFVSLLLLLSGNRNEMLLVFLPVVVAYNIFIHKIKSIFVWTGFAVGVFLMIVVGLTRQGDSIYDKNRNLYTATQDYSVVGYNCTYLIKYTDEHKPIYLAGLPYTVLSGVPFAGPIIIDVIGLKYKNTSSSITTSGMTSSYSETGLGTSLIGDLYYNAKLPFVILIMYLLGYAISKVHIRFLYDKKYNMLLLLFYLYMTSNAVYYVRSMWDFPIKDILYDSFLLYILCLIFSHNRKNIAQWQTK